ncbi:tail formation protein [Vibrio phage vB_VpaP_G1]|uniref:Tail formation protein n=1 Tax=Vibrio phage vB_VpaP_G1 TaxID=2862773 RepID=A0AAE7WVB6_9CAUD|nr:tail protein [Vibrio phage vB_VpaP_G1]QYW05821.1 tail formation protein [Vibrio phage vB_VpaP_G1]
MYNNFGKGSSSAAHAGQLAWGHHKFMEVNRGRTDNARLQHYAVNPEYVLNNNRHFIAESQMEAQPNGDSTTEGQSVQILGYAYMYEATGKKEYLDAAEKFFEAYVEHFYQEDVPDTPRRWVCNWIVNGKEPVLANWPVDFDSPTHSGFKGVELDWVNGKTQIPHGPPYWGEYVDKVTFGFRGNLGWDSIVATVYAQNEDGSTNWNKLGEEYELEYVINYEGKKFDKDGNPESYDQWGNDPVIYPPERIGEVQLKRRDINGKARLNWGNAQPVEHGGYLIKRNEAWHNRPLRVPVGKENFGNAADGEEWFMDACYKLWELTGKERYHKAWKACEFTCNEYVNIDQTDMFFRQSTWGDNPFSDGISYWYSYPSEVEPKFGRDSAGFITIDADAASQQTLEQNAIWEAVDEQATITTTIGGSATEGKVSATVTIAVGPEKKDGNLSRWMLALPELNETPTAYTAGMGSFVKEVDPNTGRKYVIADTRICVSWNEATFETEFQDNVYDDRSATVIKAHIPSSSAGFMIGAWLTETGRFPLEKLVYRASSEVWVQVTDANNWRWYMPIRGDGTWGVQSFYPDQFKLAEWQPNYPEDTPRPTKIAWHNFESVTFVQPDGKSTPIDFDFYCLNAIPLRFTGKGYTIVYALTTKADSAFHVTLGNCMARNTLGNKLYCTPGVIPFSNIYLPGQETFDGWHGMPYPGYQYPFIYVHNDHEDAKLYLDNMIEFLYQSQQWYFKKFGVLGPGASAYVWNRWDNLKYGEADTWTMYHWGDGHAWDGYQARAYFGAARAWWELEKWNKPVPQKLKDYVNNWSGFLIKYMEDWNVTPTYFPADAPPPGVTDDFTGHMCALFLAGACMAAACNEGQVNKLDWFISEAFREINDNFNVVDGKPQHVMNGSWSPALRLSTGDGPESNGMFFGFWSGEILRALGIYMLYHQGRL